MPNKLTDSEIVKAMEIFVNSVGKGFVFANVDIKKDEINEFKHIDLSYDEIFDLINRLQAKNSNLTSDLTSLQNDLTSLQNDLTSLKAENERLKKSNEMFTDIGKMYSEIKAEAYKDILNFLECRFVCKGKLTAFGYESAIIDIKNHLKELVGEE